MDLELRDKVALVGGASRGLGRAVAAALAAEGARVALCARGEEALAATAAALPAAPESVLHRAADLTRPEQLDRWIDAALERWGRVDILVNNAGGPPPGTFAELTPRQWQEAVDLLLLPPTRAIARVLPGMKERRWGRILNLTSIAVKQPVPGLMLSNAIRAALTGLAKTLADEVGPRGITVNNLAPGYFATARLEGLIADEAARRGVEPAAVRAEFTARVPLGRLGEPAELAALAAFLCSPRAGYITGATFQVDGGLYRGL